jgi:hypothetical protein
MILGHVTDLLAPRGEETFASKKEEEEEEAGQREPGGIRVNLQC